MIERFTDIPADDRLVELLTDHATMGLSEAELHELDRLGAVHGLDAAALREEWELLAAEMAVGLDADLAAAGDDEIPAHLAAACVDAGSALLASGPVGSPSAHAAHAMAEPKSVAPVASDRPLRFSPERSSRSPSPWVGWLAAACFAIVGAVGWLNQPATTPGGGGGVTPVSLQERRASLLETDPAVIKLDWAKWGEQYANVTGTVVWSQDRQEGYMTFKGLPENDPDVHRYQLWIVDGARGEPLQVPPVDGGVFDIDAGGMEVIPETGEMIVPIRAKLFVGQPVAFGITLEDPEGVVVSERRDDQLVVVQFVPQA